jgi:hypothetical protein
MRRCGPPSVEGLLMLGAVLVGAFVLALVVDWFQRRRR